MKKTMLFMCAGAALLFLVQSVAFADSTERRRIIYTDKQTYQADAVFKDTANYGSNAEITSDRKAIYPQNLIQNSLFGVWSGGSTFVIAGRAGVPDGWNIPSASTGATKVDVANTAPGTGSTVYAGFTHSVSLGNYNATTGAGTTAYFTYPSENGVSTSRTWYQQFAGKRVVFGAWVWQDFGQYAASGVTTQFIRPFINTYPGGYAAGETSFAFGDYPLKSGWNLLSAVTTVPNGATALEVGFAMNPTILAPRVTTGDSAYVCAPFLLIDPIHAGYVPVPQEVIYLRNAARFDSSNYATAGGNSSFTVAARTAGKIPEDVDALYVAFIGTPAGSTNEVHFRPSTTNVGSGATYYTALAGVSPVTAHEWVNTDYNGDFDMYSLNPVTGVTISITGVKMRK